MAKTVKVKKGTTKIADFAFSFCTNIKKVILPDTVKVIGQSAFVRCSLNYIRMPRKLKELGGSAFHRICFEEDNRIWKSGTGSNISILQKVKDSGVKGRC